MNTKIIFLFFACAVVIWACDGCGICNGGSKIQVLSRKFKYIEGLDWNFDHHILLFVDRLNHTFNSYTGSNGRVRSKKIEELAHDELAGIFPVKQSHEDEDELKLKYVLAANDSLYMYEAVLHKPDYKLDKIMDIDDDSHYLAKGVTDNHGHIVIGTIPKNYKGGSSKIYHINLRDNTKKVLDEGYDMVGGISFNKMYFKMYAVDEHKNIIYSYDYNSSKGEATNKKEILNLEEYNENYHSNITGKMVAITTDSEGYIWIGLRNSNEIIIYCPHQKMVIRRLGVPANHLTSFAWGEHHYDTLFVGTALRQQADNGRLLAITGTGHRGFVTYKVKS